MICQMNEQKQVPLNVLVGQRECGTCTKCCDGYLSGVVFDIPFFEGKPCHFVDQGTGCGIYEHRPDNPCKAFECWWLSEPNVPGWMKPNLVNAIFARGVVQDIKYIYLKEAGASLDARVLSWAVQAAVNNNYNFAWECHGGWGIIGSQEFKNAFSLVGKP